MNAHPPIALVADADGFFRLALGEILKRDHGFQTILEAGSFEEALEVIRAEPLLSLVVLDQSIHGMRQGAILPMMRKFCETAKVALVSGSGSRLEMLQALSIGVHGYIPKVVGPTEMSRALGIVMSGDIYVPSSLASAHETDTHAPAPQADAASRLTTRQLEVLEALVEGLSNKEIARRFGLGEGTVKIHVASLLKALGLPNRAAAAVYGATIYRP